MVGALGEPHLAEQLERSLSRTADRDELCLDVLHRGERRDQVELLEDESERAQAERRELGRRATLEELRDTAQLVHRAHQSTCLSASAGRSRAARIAPAVPAMRPPRSASSKPRTRTPPPIGASSETLEVAVRVAAAPRPRTSVPVVELALSVGPN